MLLLYWSILLLTSISAQIETLMFNGAMKVIFFPSLPVWMYNAKKRALGDEASTESPRRPLCSRAHNDERLDAIRHDNEQQH